MEPYEQFLNDASAALLDFPELRLSLTDGIPVLTGFVDLLTKEGDFVDRYEIEIHAPIDYPKSYPRVYETGGRLPWNIDFHVYPDGSFCIAVPAQERVDCSRGINLTGFIQSQVSGFLFSQTFRSRNGYFYQERSHGTMGKLQFYDEYFGLQEGMMVLNAMKMIATNNEQRGHTPCFCGSQRKFQKCHRRAVRELTKAAASIVTADWNEIL